MLSRRALRQQVDTRETSETRQKGAFLGLWFAHCGGLSAMSYACEVTPVSWSPFNMAVSIGDGPR